MFENLGQRSQPHCQTGQSVRYWTPSPKSFCRTNRWQRPVPSDLLDFDRERVMPMTKGAVDRRVARTKATLHQTLMSLILKRGYEAITIRDICDEANVGRSTFYAHYTSKDDLMRSGIENLRKVLVDRQQDALATEGDIRHRSFGFSLALFERPRPYRPPSGADRGRRRRPWHHSPDTLRCGPRRTCRNRRQEIRGRHSARTRRPIHCRRLHGRIDLVARPGRKAAACAG